MRFLVIGGTSFIGLHVVEHALAAGHEVTIFNRGRTNPEVFPQVERLTGDRERPEELEVLRGRDWDAVVDTCGFDHRVVQLSTDVLRGHVGHYTFVSSIAAYRDFSHANKEDDPKAEVEGDIDNPQERAIGGSSLYGPMKVLCEGVINEAFDRAVIVRLTAGAGPGDHGASTRRMAYWGQRVRDYDEILVPGPPDRLVAYIDVRDMTAWMVRMAEQGGTGAYNAAAPSLTIERFLELAREVYDTDTKAVYVDPDWLLEQGIKANVEVPWWIPGENERYRLAVDGSKGIAAGLNIRPIEETIRDSVEWEDVRPRQKLVPGSKFSGQAPGTSLSRERELELLELWRARAGETAITT
jgi:2'-hydroxyisoflavone reductase